MAKNDDKNDGEKEKGSTSTPEQTMPSPTSPAKEARPLSRLLAACKVDISYEISGAESQVLTSVIVGKPSKHEFIRISGSPDDRAVADLLELKDEGKTYVVLAGLAPRVREQQIDVTRRELFAAVTSTNRRLLVPVGVADENGVLNPWHASLRFALRHAETEWVKIRSNRSIGAYQAVAAAGALPDPTWPYTFSELFECAFEGAVIDSLDHPILRRLRGETA